MSFSLWGILVAISKSMNGIWSLDKWPPFGKLCCFLRIVNIQGKNITAGNCQGTQSASSFSGKKTTELGLGCSSYSQHCLESWSCKETVFLHIIPVHYEKQFRILQGLLKSHLGVVISYLSSLCLQGQIKEGHCNDRLPVTFSPVCKLSAVACHN